jgi:hypothetical protein
VRLQKLLIWFSLLAGHCISLGQTPANPKETYSSLAHGYTVTIPKSFWKETLTRKNIDLKFVDDYGSSILFHVTDRLPEEDELDGHSYSKEGLEAGIRPLFPNFKIDRTEKTTVGGQKAFVAESTGGGSSKLKELNCYLYYKDKAYLITCSSEIRRFDAYRTLFNEVLKTVKLSK